MIAVVLPHTLEVRLRRDRRWLFVREHNILFLDDLWSKFADSIVLSLESSSTFWGGSINAKDDSLALVGMCKGV